MTEQTTIYDQAKENMKTITAASKPIEQPKAKEVPGTDKPKQEQEQELTISPESLELIDLSKGTTFTNNNAFQFAKRMASVLATSDMVPDTYRNKVGNCLIVIDLANRLGISPMTVFQNLDIIYGRPAWRSQYKIGMINSNPRLGGRLQYEFRGEEGKDTWGCRAFMIDKDKIRLDGPWIDIAMAKREGWFDKKGSKWASIPEKMLRYRSSSWFADIYCPEAFNGIMSVDEVLDISDAITVQGEVATVEELR